MKVLLVFSLLIASSAFAESIDLRGLKSLMTQKKSVLELASQGMSKRVVTLSQIPTELGPCAITETSIETILKIEGENMIVHSKERYVPASTPACAGFETQDVAVIFYDETPSLEKSLADLDEQASDIKSINRDRDIISMNLNVSVSQDDGTDKIENVSVKYDLSKPLFKNTILIQDSQSKVTEEDIANIDVNTINLTNVLFCESADSDVCSEGDFSDILF